MIVNIFFEFSDGGSLLLWSATERVVQSILYELGWCFDWLFGDAVLFRMRGSLWS